MFVTLISFRGTFKSFWDLSEVSEQSWYKVLTDELVNPKISLSSVLPCVAVCYSVLPYVAVHYRVMHCRMLQCITGPSRA